MYAIDFEYDGQRLSDYGFIICDFNSADGWDDVEAGANITFNKVTKNQGKSFSLASAEFEDCITATFGICKNPDLYEPEEMEIAPHEFHNLMRWLNRREFLKFCVYDEDENKERIIYYNASFNVSKIKLHEILYGLQVEMETDRPFGYGLEEIINLSFPTAESSCIVLDKSDDIGSIYPLMRITCSQAGDLEITNKFNSTKSKVKGCKTGEIITLDCESQIIQTSIPEHDLCDDFNYEFIRLGNIFRNNENVIVASIPCEIEMRYSPIIKDIP